MSDLLAMNTVVPWGVGDCASAARSRSCELSYGATKSFQHQRYSLDSSDAAMDMVWSWGTVLSLLATLGVAVVVAAMAACLWPSIDTVRRADESNIDESVFRTEHTEMRSLLRIYSTPAQLLEVDAAHRCMQVHLNCDPGGCRQKAKAMSALEAAGRMTRDRSRRL
ncbi:hypothetical protein ABIA39_000512 [Nocardia sp. GAS34]|uniref:hypothetical protein n=1 Tax=unclassified Nocardia TaxID=2637762 RepID=UPI003D1E8F25